MDIAEQANILADNILKHVPRADIEAAIGLTGYEKYQDNPIGFIEEVLNESPTADIKEMMLSVRDNVTTIARSANGTGKTWGAARLATWFYKCFPECQVWTAAAPPEDNLKKLLWGEIGNVLNTHKEVFKNDDIKTLHVQRTPLQFMTGVTIPASGTHTERVAKFSGKHAPVLVFILDEGDAIPDAVYEGIESCMSGGTIVRLLIMFNPRHESGEVWRKERSGLANVVEMSAFRHPNVITGKDLIPGAVSRQVTCQRIHDWCKPLDNEELKKYEKGNDHDIFELPKFLEGVVVEKQKKGEFYPPLKPGPYKVENHVFHYMVLGKYPSQGASQLISREWIDNARARWDAYVARFREEPPKGVSCVMGQDVAEEGVDSNTSCFRWGGFVERFVDWSKIDVIETGDRAAEEYHARSPMKHCAVDATGVGVGVAPHMRRLGCNAFKIKVAERNEKICEFGEFGLVRDEIMWAVREWLRTDTGAMLPPDDDLIEELMCPTWKTVGKYVKVLSKDGKDGMRALLKRSPDKFDALALTFAQVKIKKRITAVRIKPADYAWS